MNGRAPMAKTRPYGARVARMAAAGASIPANGWVGVAPPSRGGGVDRRAQRLGQVGQGIDGAGGPDVAAGDDGQLPDGRLGEQLGQLGQGPGRRPAHDGRRRRHRGVALLVESRHGQAHEHGTTGRA
jgi:hypothetical protein